MALGTLLVLLVGLLWAWWPNGQYRPVRADERGTVTQLLSPASSSTPVRTTALAMIPQRGVTEAHPALLVQRDGDALRAVVVSKDGVGRAFPFSLPSAPRPGDNQAVAINTTDGSTVYDVAVVLLTLQDGQDVGNANTAYALASCARCRTVAVAFQVLLVVGHSDYIAPVNAAVAGNQDCLQCVTTALAQQLVVTLRETPSPEVQAQLQTAMARLGNLKGLDPALIYSELADVQRDIVTALTDAGLVEAVTTTQATASATPDPGVSASPTAAPTDSSTPDPGATADPTATDTTTAPATADPSPTDPGTPAPSDPPATP
jgi:putative peptide zinc metalloprotease protein